MIPLFALNLLKSPTTWKWVGYGLIALTIGFLVWKWNDMSSTIVEQKAKILKLDDELAAQVRLLKDVEAKDHEKDDIIHGLQTVTETQRKSLDNYRVQVRKLKDIVGDPELAKAFQDAWNLRLRCIELVTGSVGTPEEIEACK